MDFQTVLILCVIGLSAGILSGFVGVGGGIIIVPALIYLLGMTQHQAQGTSLFLMLPPIGVLAVYNYYQSGSINFWYGAIIAILFVIGGYFGSKWALKLDANIVRFIFGIIMLYVALKLILSSYKSVFNGS